MNKTKNSLTRIGITTCVMALCLLAAGCRTPQKTTSKAVYSFKDDVAPYRPTVEAVAAAPDEGNRPTAPAGVLGSGAPTHDVTDEVDQLMAEVRDRNDRIRVGRGFRVQVYTGTDREEATRAKARVYQAMSDLNVYTTYQQPTFRVQAGDFLNQLEAQKAFAQLKTIFPAALLVNEQVNLPKRTN